MSKHREPKALKPETVIVDVVRGYIYRISGETLALLRNGRVAR